ncbi:uncharacterized protein LOC135848526 [Planococcus citri]|uniref:uncharacterized protein LOC135848526 n=1 Tax=Planococcus citri TaxID=170843 RepID=UPI0031F80FE4
MKFLIAIFSAILLFKTIECTCDQDLTVIVSFESLHKLSIWFFKNQFAPVYEELTKCVKWHFIPCSTTQIVDQVKNCDKDDLTQCNLDAMHACAAHIYEDHQYELGKFFICMMTDAEAYCNADQCAKNAGLEWEKIKKCKPSTDAAEYCLNRWNQLNILHVVHVPGVFFNWRYNQSVDEHIFKNFKTHVCERLQKMGKTCDACPPCSAPPSSTTPNGQNSP